MKIKLYFIALVILTSSIGVFGQDTTSIATEKVEVIKNYEAIIQQASIKKVPITGIEKQKVNINYNYDLQTKVDLDFDRPNEIIRPLSFTEDKPKFKDLKDGQIYAAYGNYKTLSLGAAYHYYIEDWLDAGFKVDHFSSKDDTLPHQKFNRTNAKLYASYFLSKLTKAGAAVNYSRFDHYSPLLIGQDSLIATEQAFNSIGGALSFSTTAFENAGISLRSRVSYDRLEQSVDSTKETLLKVELNGIKRISDKLSLEVPFEYHSTKFTLAGSEGVRFNDLLVRPQIRLTQEAFSIRMGAEFINADSSKFIFPIVDLVFRNLYQDFKLRLYTKSQYSRNSMHYLSSVNPYYRTDLTQLTPNYLRTYAVQFEMPYRNLIFNLDFSYNDYTGDDLHLDRTDTNRAIVNSIDRTEWRISPSVNYQSSAIDMILKYEYNIFLGDNKNALLYRPKSRLMLAGSEKLLDNKVIFRQELSFVSARRHTHLSDDDRMLDSYLDLSLGLDLNLSKSLIVYAKASNVLATEYQVWFNHPVFQRQIWAGFKLNI